MTTLMTGSRDALAGPGGLIGVGSGWGSTSAWLLAAAALAALSLVAWWLVRRDRPRPGRGEELALRRYGLQHPADPAPEGRDPRRRDPRRRR